MTGLVMFLAFFYALGAVFTFVQLLTSIFAAFGWPRVSEARHWLRGLFGAFGGAVLWPYVWIVR